MVAHNETHDTEAVDERTSLLHQNGSSDNYKTLNPQKHVEPAAETSDDGGDRGDGEKEFPTATIRAVFPILLMGAFRRFALAQSKLTGRSRRVSGKR